MKFAEGDNVTLTCRVFGAPTPKISWKRTRQQEVVEVSGNQFVALTSGDLLIKVFYLLYRSSLSVVRSHDSVHKWSIIFESFVARINVMMYQTDV